MESTDSAESASEDQAAARPRRSSSRSGQRNGKRPRTKAIKAASGGIGGMAWSTVALFAAAALFALAVIGYAGWRVWDKTRPFGEQKDQQIADVVNYREKNPGMLTNRHVEDAVKYPVSPPVGGNHNTAWENCEGDVYAAQIPNEHAVHSLEHGAVWVTYRPDLPADQVDTLKKKVQGRDFMLMSPYPGLDSPISLQAWGFQLKVDSADDKRIDDFIVAFRKHASIERGTGCSGGITVTGTTPVNTGGMQPPQ